MTFELQDRIGRSVRIAEDSMWGTCGYRGTLRQTETGFELNPVTSCPTSDRVEFARTDVFFIQAFRETNEELTIRVQLKKR